jgi:hypothetical protein
MKKLVLETKLLSCLKEMERDGKKFYSKFLNNAYLS